MLGLYLDTLIIGHNCSRLSIPNKFTLQKGIANTFGQKHNNNNNKANIKIPARVGLNQGSLAPQSGALLLEHQVN